MAPYPEEIDVFSVPHSRMKKLVDVYNKKLMCMDFADYIALQSFLGDLKQTFYEFKSHETIENKYIMKKLKQRLKSLSIHDAAVCNCHSDNRLSDMLDLFNAGYHYSSKPASERIDFGLRLQSALQEFTGVFLPHMKEEEEVFQPMLMKYFEYEELKCLKKRVIEEHENWCIRHPQNEKAALEERAKQPKPSEKAERNVHLPPEILSHIFSYLQPNEIIQCSEVCREWYDASRNPALWKELYPCYWSHGIWDDYDDNHDDMREKLYPTDSQFNKRHTSDYENYDYEDTTYSDEDSDAGALDCHGVSDDVQIRESSMINTLVKSLLPKIGTGVRKIVLSWCKGLSSAMLRSILELCPNVVYLDVSYTAITDSAFKGLKDSFSCSKIQHLDLSGCKAITDLGLYRLAECIASAAPVLPDGSSYLREVYLDNCCKSSNSCACKQNVCLEIEESGYLFRGSQTDWCNFCTSDRFCNSSCFWKRDGFMCYLARQVQQCPFVNTCAYSTPCDISNAADQILRTTGSVESSADSAFSSSLTERSNNEERSLRYLNLSGCNEITDEGMRCLIEVGIFTHLEFLDVSGCWQLSGSVLCCLADFAPMLLPENMYYCNRIEDGPYPESANGCENLESNYRVCCCNRSS